MKRVESEGGRGVRQGSRVQLQDFFPNFFENQSDRWYDRVGAGVLFMCRHCFLWT